MAEEEHGLHEEPRPSEHRKVSPVEREREWLAKQYSKEREAYWEKDTGSLMKPSEKLGPTDSGYRCCTTRCARPGGADEQGQHPDISIVCLGCLIDDHPEPRPWSRPGARVRRRGPRRRR